MLSKSSRSCQVTTKLASGILDVASVIAEFDQGSSKGYDALVTQLSSAATPAGVLQKHLKGLKDSVTVLDKRHELLVGVILKIDWASGDRALVELYQSFILDLVTVHTDYLKATLRMIVKAFCPRMFAGVKVNSDLDDAEKKKLDSAFINVHQLLVALTKLVPMSTSLLLPLLVAQFPYVTVDVYIQRCYVVNLLQLCQYTPQLRPSVLELVVDKMIRIDASCPRDEIKETDPSPDTDPDSADGMFTMEDTGGRKAMNHKEANTLDCLMALVLKYIHDTCHTHGQLDWAATKQLYREMLFIFEKLILPTHACCHVQFVMFYLCSLRPAITDGFLDYLWKRVQDPNIEAVYRHAAVSYIGSLLARGMFITLSTIKHPMELMMRWVHAYLDEAGQEGIMADLAHHRAFYAVCQAVFYVIVFRGRELFDTKGGVKWAEGLNFQRVVTSRLNPLKVCLPVIVQTFASVTRIHQLALCDTIIERNNRAFLPVADTTFGSGADCIPTTLDSYFPFDPYLLHKSSVYFTPHYREFKGSLEDTSIESSDDEDEMFTEDTSRATPTGLDVISPTSTPFDVAPFDFMHYGTSPGFQHV